MLTLNNIYLIHLFIFAINVMHLLPAKLT